MPSAPFDVVGLTMLAMLLVALLLPPALVYEPVWELAAGLGYVACCAAVLTLRISPRPRVALTAYRFSLHRVAGNALLVLVALHVAVMVAGDPFLLDYLGWTMPWHVLAGILGAVALLLAVATREPVLRGWLRLPGDPRLHSWSAIAAALLAAAHVLPTAGKPTSAWRGALLAGLFAALVLWATGRRAGRWPSPGCLEPTAVAPRAGQRLLLVLGALLLLLAACPVCSPVGAGEVASRSTRHRARPMRRRAGDRFPRTSRGNRAGATAADALRSQVPHGGRLRDLPSQFSRPEPGAEEPPCLPQGLGHVRIQADRRRVSCLLHRVPPAAADLWGSGRAGQVVCGLPCRG